MTRILDAAMALHDAGCCVLPAAADGSKRPAVDWKRWQHERPDRMQTAGLVSQATGIGVVCGHVSGNLEMLEAEGHATPLLPAVTAAMDDHGLGHVWRQITTGYAETTPGGGLHWLLRTPGPAHPNRKLARRPNHDNPRDIEVLFETRGEGGWVVTAPSAGTTHPTGRPWALIAGSPANIPTISTDDRDAVYAVLGLFDTMPTIDGRHPTSSSGEATGDRPGDDFNAKATWADILNGWTIVRRMGAGYAWRRPGKRDGISATTGQSSDGVDRLYVFTTSTSLPSEVPLTKFGAHTHLEHGGDYAAAARQLRADGYGAPANRGPRLEDLVEQPADRPTNPTDRGSEPVEATEERPTNPTDPGFIERTEDAQALALVETVGHLIRRNTTSQRWHTYTSGVWNEQTDGGQVREYARALARSLPETDRNAAAWRKTMLSDTGIRHILSMASSDPRITATAASFDADPWLLGHGPLVTDLRTGTTRTATSADMISRATAVAPGTDGQHVWQQFLDSILDPDSQGFLQRICGLALLGEVREHILPFLFGTGANGKTTFMDAIRHTFGRLAVSLPAETLMIRRHDPHPTELAPLAGARLAVFNELPPGMRFDEARVKVLTGGDMLSARFLYGNPFDFRPSHSLFVVGNDKPATTSGGEAFWRRVRLIGFHTTIPAQDRDPNLPARLRDAAPAVLAWCIQGLIDYQRDGLAEPASVVADTAEYRAENDTVGRFLDECCHVTGNPGIKIEARQVRSAYEQWCQGEGLPAVTNMAFGLALQRVGVTQSRSHGRRFYIGLSLLAADAEMDGWR